MDDQFGIESNFRFRVREQSLSSLDQVINRVERLQKSVKTLEDTRYTQDVGKNLSRAFDSSSKTARKNNREFQKTADNAKKVRQQLKPFKTEMQAIKAESKNVDFGDTFDERQFKRAQRQIQHYRLELQKLESQVQGNTAEERKFLATLRKERRALKDRVELQKAQRSAVRASYSQSEFGALQALGQGTERLNEATRNVVSTFATFDDSMSKVAAISGATGDKLDELRHKAKQMGSTTAFSASQAAEAESFLAMAGLKANEVVEALPSTLDLASAGKLELAESADIASNALSSFSLKAEEMGRVSDVLASTATSANTSVQQLGEAMSYAGPAASSLNVSLEETAALIGVGGNIGVQGSSAGTALRAGLVNLSKSSKQNELRNVFGVESIDEETGRMRNVVDIIGDIRNSINQKFRGTEAEGKFNKLSEQFQNNEIAAEEFQEQLKQLEKQYPQQAAGLGGLADVFGKRALPFWLGQISQYDVLQENVQALQESEGAAKKMATTMEDNLAGAFRALGSAMEAFKIAYVEPLVPVIEAVVRGLANTLRFLSDLPAPIRFLGGTIAALTVTLSGASLVIGSLGTLLFSYTEAAATAQSASLALGRSAIPMTGFFQTAMDQIVATNPVESLYKITKSWQSNLDSLLANIREYNRYTIEALGNAFTTVRRQAIAFVQSINFQNAIAAVRSLRLGFVSLSRSILAASYTFLSSPFVAVPVGLLLINTFLEKAIPGFNLLGTAIAGITAPLGFVWGFVKGITKGILELFGVTTSGIKTVINPFVENISGIFKTAIEGFQRFSKSGERLGYEMVKVIIDAFQWAGDRIVALWRQAIGGIRDELRPLTSFVRWVGSLLVSSLAENSPGPTMLIRHFWEQTVQFIKSSVSSLLPVAKNVSSTLLQYFSTGLSAISRLIVRSVPRLSQIALEALPAGIGIGIALGIYQGLKNALSSSVIVDSIQQLNAATVGLGDVTEQMRRQARRNVGQQIGDIFVEMQEGILSAIELLDRFHSFLNKVVHDAIQNLDILAQALLIFSSLPLTMLGYLNKGAEQIFPILEGLIYPGIPRAFVRLLPAAVAIGASTGLIRGFEQGFSQFLDTLPSLLVRWHTEFIGPLSESTESAIRQTTTNVVDYLHKVGDVAQDIARGARDAIAPILEFSLLPAVSLPLIPGLTVVRPALLGIADILESPAIRGITGFLTDVYIQLSLVLSTLLRIAAAPILGPLNRFRQSVIATLSESRQLVQLVSTSAVATYTQIFQNINAAIARTPVIGKALSSVMNTLASAYLFAVREIKQVLPEILPALLGQVRSLGTTIGSSLWQGIRYSFAKGVVPIVTLLLRGLDPTSAGKLVANYFKTSGFRNILTPKNLWQTLFAINPLDMAASMQSQLARMFSVALGGSFPRDIAEQKSTKLFQQFADIEAMAKAGEMQRGLQAKGIMKEVPVSFNQIYKSQGRVIQGFMSITRSLMSLSPWMQILGRMYTSVSLFYSLLKPINREMLRTIENTEVLGVQLTFIADTLRILRFLFVDLVDFVMPLLRAIPGLIMFTAKAFHFLSKIVHPTIRGISVAAVVAFNTVKWAIVNPLLSIPLYLSKALKLGLEVVRDFFQELISRFQVYGDRFGDAFEAMAQGRVIDAWWGILGTLFLMGRDFIGGFFHYVLSAAQSIISPLADIFTTIVSYATEPFKVLFRLITEPRKEIQRLRETTEKALSAIFNDTLIPFVESLGLSTEYIVNNVGKVIGWIAGISAAVWQIVNYTSPLARGIQTIIGLTAFMFQQYNNGFKQIRAFVDFLQHPIEILEKIINGIERFQESFVALSSAEILARITEYFVRLMPYIIGGLSVVGMLLHGNILGGFKLIGQVVTGFVDRLQSIVGVFSKIGQGMRDVYKDPRVELATSKAAHAVRSKYQVAGIQNPFRYGDDITTAQSAVQTRETGFQTAEAVMRYEKQRKKQLNKEIERQKKRNQQAFFDNPEEYPKYVKKADPKGFRGALGISQYELTEAGKSQAIQMADNQANKQFTNIDEDEKDKLLEDPSRRKAAEKSGLLDLLKKQGKSEAEISKAVGEIDKRLGNKAAANTASRVLEGFNQGIKNLYTEKLQVGKLDPLITRSYLAPEKEPYNSEAARLQYQKLQKEYKDSHSENLISEGENRAVQEVEGRLKEISQGVAAEITGQRLQNIEGLTRFETTGQDGELRNLTSDMTETPPSGLTNELRREMMENLRESLNPRTLQYDIQREAKRAGEDPDEFLKSQENAQKVIAKAIDSERKKLYTSVISGLRDRPNLDPEWIENYTESNAKAVRQQVKEFGAEGEAITQGADVYLQAINRTTQGLTNSAETINSIGQGLSRVFRFTGIPQLLQNRSLQSEIDAERYYRSTLKQFDQQKSEYRKRKSREKRQQALERAYTNINESGDDRNLVQQSLRQENLQRFLDTYIEKGFGKEGRLTAPASADDRAKILDFMDTLTGIGPDDLDDNDVLERLQKQMTKKQKQTFERFMKDERYDPTKHFDLVKQTIIEYQDQLQKTDDQVLKNIMEKSDEDARRRARGGETIQKLFDEVYEQAIKPDSGEARGILEWIKTGTTNVTARTEELDRIAELLRVPKLSQLPKIGHANLYENLKGGIQDKYEDIKTQFELTDMTIQQGISRISQFIGSSRLTPGTAENVEESLNRLYGDQDSGIRGFFVGIHNRISQFGRDLENTIKTTQIGKRTRSQYNQLLSTRSQQRQTTLGGLLETFQPEEGERFANQDLIDLFNTAISNASSFRGKQGRQLYSELEPQIYEAFMSDRPGDLGKSLQERLQERGVGQNIINSIVQSIARETSQTEQAVRQRFQRQDYSARMMEPIQITFIKRLPQFIRSVFADVEESFNTLFDRVSFPFLRDIAIGVGRFTRSNVAAAIYPRIAEIGNSISTWFANIGDTVARQYGLFGIGEKIIGIGTRIDNLFGRIGDRVQQASDYVSTEGSFTYLILNGISNLSRAIYNRFQQAREYVQNQGGFTSAIGNLFSQVRSRFTRQEASSGETTSEETSAPLRRGIFGIAKWLENVQWKIDNKQIPDISTRTQFWQSGYGRRSVPSPDSSRTDLGEVRTDIDQQLSWSRRLQRSALTQVRNLISNAEGTISDLGISLPRTWRELLPETSISSYSPDSPYLPTARATAREPESLPNAAPSWQENLRHSISEFFSNLPQRMQEIPSAIRNTLSTSAKGVLNFLEDVWGSVFEGLWENAYRTLQPIGQRISEFVSNWHQRIQRISSAIRNTLSQIPGAIRNTLSSSWESVREFFSNWHQGMQEIPGTIRNALSTSARFLEDVWGSVFEGLWENTYRALQSIGQSIGNVLSSSANRFILSWNWAVNVVQGLWRGAVNVARRIGYRFRRFLASGSPGPARDVPQQWEEASDRTSQEFQEMATNAQQAGERIEQGMGNAAHRTQLLFQRLNETVSGIGKTGFAAGALVSVAGTAAQSIGSSLGTLGVLNEETQDLVYKASETVTVLGSIGSVAAPALNLIVSTLGTTVGIVGTLTTAITGLGSAIAGLAGLTATGLTPLLIGLATIGTAIAGVYWAFQSNFLGIGDLLRQTGGLIYNALITPVNWIVAAWQGLTDRFGHIISPVLAPAIELGQNLIDALNHSPTERIPEAWNEASGRILDSMDAVKQQGQGVAEDLERGFLDVIGGTLKNVTDAVGGFFKRDKNNIQVEQLDRGFDAQIDVSRQLLTENSKQSAILKKQESLLEDTTKHVTAIAKHTGSTAVLEQPEAEEREKPLEGRAQELRNILEKQQQEIGSLQQKAIAKELSKHSGSIDKNELQAIRGRVASQALDISEERLSKVLNKDTTPWWSFGKETYKDTISSEDLNTLLREFRQGVRGNITQEDILEQIDKNQRLALEKEDKKYVKSEREQRGWWENLFTSREERITSEISQQQKELQRSSELGFQEVVQKAIQSKKKDIGETIIDAANSESEAVRKQHRKMVSYDEQGQLQLNAKGQAEVEQRMASMLKNREGLFSEENLGKIEKQIESLVTEEAQQRAKQVKAESGGLFSSKISDDRLTEIQQEFRKIATQGVSQENIVDSIVQSNRFLEDAKRQDRIFNFLQQIVDKLSTLGDILNQISMQSSLGLSDIDSSKRIREQLSSIDNTINALAEKVSPVLTQISETLSSLGTIIAEELNKQLGRKTDSSQASLSRYMEGESFGINPTIENWSNLEDHWSHAEHYVANKMHQLSRVAEREGYNIQRALAEGSPGTTQRIRKHWEETEGEVSKDIENIEKQAEVSGQNLEGNLSADPALQANAAMKDTSKQTAIVGYLERIVEGIERVHFLLRESPVKRYGAPILGIARNIIMVTGVLKAIQALIPSEVAGLIAAIRNLSLEKGRSTRNQEIEKNSQRKRKWSEYSDFAGFLNFLPIIGDELALIGGVIGFALSQIFPVLKVLRIAIPLGISLISVIEKIAGETTVLGNVLGVVVWTFSALISAVKAFFKNLYPAKYLEHVSNRLSEFAEGGSEFGEKLVNSIMEGLYHLPGAFMEFIGAVDAWNWFKTEPPERPKTLSEESLNKVREHSNKTKKYWEETEKSATQNMRNLSDVAAKEGHNIQRSLAEGSPGTTQRIRMHWGETEDEVSKDIENIEKQAEVSGERLVGSLSADPTLQVNTAMMDTSQEKATSVSEEGATAKYLDKIIGYPEVPSYPSYESMPGLRSVARNLKEATKRPPGGPEQDTRKRHKETEGNLSAIPALQTNAAMAGTSKQATIVGYLQNMANMLERIHSILRGAVIEKYTLAVLNIVRKVISVIGILKALEALIPAEIAGVVKAIQTRDLEKAKKARNKAAKDRKQANWSTYTPLLNFLPVLGNELALVAGAVSFALSWFFPFLRVLRLAIPIGLTVVRTIEHIAGETTVLGNVLGPVVWLFSALTSTVKTFFDSLYPAEYLQHVSNRLSEFAEGGTEFGEKLGNNLVQGLLDLPANIAEAAKEGWEKFKSSTQVAISTALIGLEFLSNFVQKVFKDISNFVQQAFNGITKAFGGLWEVLTLPFQESSNETKKHWKDTEKTLEERMVSLSGVAEEQGYNIQKSLAKGSPGLLTNIENFWQEAVESLSNMMGGLGEHASSVGSWIQSSFNIDFSQAQEGAEKSASWFSNLASKAKSKLFPEPQTAPTPPPKEPVEPSSVEEEAEKVKAARAGEMEGYGIARQLESRLRYLERSDATNIHALFAPGIEKTRGSIALLGDSFSRLGQEAGEALVNMNFDKLRESINRFADRFSFAFQQVITGFKEMSLSAVAFGVYSVLGISPLTAAMVGIAFLGSAIAANFLGIRTILVGLFKVAWGLGRTLLSLLGAIRDSISPILQILKGTLFLLQGDFSGFVSHARTYLSQLQQIWTNAFYNIRAHLGVALDGVLTIVRGLGQALQQVGWLIGKIFFLPTDKLQKGIQDTTQKVRSLLTSFSSSEEMGRAFADAIIRGLYRIRDALVGLRQWISRTATQWSYNFYIQSMQALYRVKDFVVRVPQLLREMATHIKNTLTQKGLGIAAAFVVEWHLLLDSIRNFDPATAIRSLGKLISKAFSLTAQEATGTFQSKLFSGIRKIGQSAIGFVRGFLLRLGEEFPKLFASSYLVVHPQQLQQSLVTSIQNISWKEVGKKFGKQLRRMWLFGLNFTMFGDNPIYWAIRFGVMKASEVVHNFFVRLEQRWANVQDYFKNNNPLAGFFSSIREAIVRWDSFVERLQEKWKNGPIQNERIWNFVNNFLSGLRRIGVTFEEWLSKIEARWDRVRRFLAEGTFISNFLGSLEEASAAFKAFTTFFHKNFNQIYDHVAGFDFLTQWKKDLQSIRIHWKKFNRILQGSRILVFTQQIRHLLPEVMVYRFQKMRDMASDLVTLFRLFPDNPKEIFKHPIQQIKKIPAKEVGRALLNLIQDAWQLAAVTFLSGGPIGWLIRLSLVQASGFLFRFFSGIEKRWSNLQNYLANNNPLKGFFELLRDGILRWDSFIEGIKRKWQSLPIQNERIKNLVNNLLNGLQDIGLALDKPISKLESAWEYVRMVLATNTSVSNLLGGLREVSGVLNRISKSYYENFVRIFEKTIGLGFLKTWKQDIEHIKSQWTQWMSTIRDSRLATFLLQTFDGVAAGFKRTIDVLRNGWLNLQEFFRVHQFSLGPIFEGWRDRIYSFLDFLEKTFLGGNNPLTNFLYSTFDFIFKSMDKVEAAWKRLAKYLGNEKILSGLLTALQWISTKFAYITRIVRQQWQPFFKGLGNASWVQPFLSALSKIPDAFGKVAKYAQHAISWISKRWEAFAKGFQSILSPIVAVASWIASKLIAALNCYPTERIPQAWKKAVTNIIGSIGTLITSIRGGVGNTVSWLSDRIKELGQAFKPVTTSAQNALGPLGRFLRTLGRNIALPSLVSGFKSLGRSLQILWDSLRGIGSFNFSFLQSFWQNVSPEVKSLARTISEISSYFGSLISSAKQLLKSLVQSWQATREVANAFSWTLNLVRPIEGVLNSIYQVSQKIVSPLQSVGAVLGNVVGRTLATLLVVVDESLRAIPGTIDRILAGARLVANIVSNVVQRVLAGIRLVARVVNSVLEKVGNFFDSVKQQIDTRIISPLKAITEPLRQGLSSFLNWAWGQIGAFLEKVRNQIGQTFSGLNPFQRGNQNAQPPTSVASQSSEAETRQAQKQTGILRRIQNVWTRNNKKTTQAVQQQWLHANENIQSSWYRTVRSVGTNLQNLADEAHSQGYMIQRYVAEGSPGILPLVRSSWAYTADFVGGKMDDMAASASEAGSRIRQSFTVPADELQQNISRVGREYGEVGRSLQRTSTSVGAAMSNFAPNIATPLFMINDFVDAATDLNETLPTMRRNIPQIRQGMGRVGSGIASIASYVPGLQKVAVAIWGMAGAAARFLGLGLFGTIGTIIGGAIAAVFALKKAFEHNFLGIRSLFDFVFGGIWRFIKGIFSGIVSILGDLFTAIDRAFKKVASAVLAPFQGAIAFLRSGHIERALLQPLKWIANFLSSIISFVGDVVTKLVETIVRRISTAVSIVKTLLSGVWKVISGIWTVVSSAIGGIFHVISQITSAIQGTIQKLLMLGGTLYAVVQFTGIIGGIAATAISPFVAAIGAAVAVGYLLRDVLVFIWQVVKGYIVGAFQIMRDLLSDVWSSITSLWKPIKELGVAIWNAFAPLFSIFGGGKDGAASKGNKDRLVNLITQGLLIPLRAASWLISTLVKAVTQALGFVIQALTTAFKIVGFVSRIVATVLKPGFWTISKVLQIVGFVLKGIAVVLWRTIAPVFRLISTLARWIVQGVGHLFNLLWSIGKNILPWLSPVFWIFKGVKGIVGWIANKIGGGDRNSILGAFQTVGNVLFNVFIKPFQVVQSIVSWIVSKISWLMNAITDSPLVKFAGFVGDAIKGTWNFLTGNKKEDVEKRAKGGYVQGAGTNVSDSIPSMLSSGEFVVAAKQAAGNLGLLEKINRGEDPFLEVIDNFHTGLKTFLDDVGLVEAPTPVEPLPPRFPTVPKTTPVPASDSGSSGTQTSKEMPPIQVNLNVENINLNGGGSEEEAREFVSKLDPHLREAFRRYIEEEMDYMR